MYKAIVADDEDIIRKGIVSFLKEDCTIEVVADACDGLEALTFAERYLPDIIFVDINMPNMNGLELMEKLNDLEKEILVIVVTGYSDFKYAQKAIRLGVFDYFLKPIMEEPFYSSLDKAKKYLEEQKTLNLMYDQIKETTDYAIERILNQLSLGLITEDKCRESLNRLNLNTEKDLELFLIYPGCFDNYKMKNADTDSADIEIPYLIKKTALEMLNTTGFYISFVNSYDHIVFLVEKQNEKTVESFKDSFCFSLEMLHLDHVTINSLPEIYIRSITQIKEQVHYSQQVQLTLDFIKRNYSNPRLTLAMISSASNASPGHLGRLCKEELHRSPMDYLSHYRVKKASKLLSDKSLKIYEVAEQVGFTSQHYFCNSFKKITGQPPREYRNSLENQ